MSHKNKVDVSGSSLVHENSAHSNNASATRKEADESRLFSAIQSGNAIDSLAFFDHIRENKERYNQDILDHGLVLACIQGRKFLVQILLAYGANIETRDKDGNTPLLVCAEKVFTDIALLLVDKGADINSYNKDGDTALLLSIQTSGSTNLVKKLSRHEQLNFSHKNNTGCTALSKCFEVLDFSLLQSFKERMKERGNPEHKINGDLSGLSKSCVDIAHTLGLDLIYSSLNIERLTFLQHAVFNKDIRLIQLLLCNDTSGGGYYLMSEFIQFLIERKVDVDESVLRIIQLLLDSKLVNCSIPLSKAVELGNLELLELLCPKNMDSYEVKSSLISAIEDGRCDILEFFIKHGVKLNSIVYFDTAIKFGHIDCVKLLHKSGTVVDLATTIHTAAKNNRPNSLQVLTELYKQDTEKALKDIGPKMLIESVKDGFIEVVHILIKAGADVNSVVDGKTALMAAKDSNILELLIQLGADVNKVVSYNYETYTVLSYILKEYLSKKLYLGEDNLQMAKIIVKHSDDLDQTISGSDTLLMLAVKIPNSLNLVVLLLQFGVEVSRQNNEGKSALHLAVEHRSVAIVRVLLDNKANVNSKCINGLTPLMIAVSTMDDEMIQLLLDSGATVEAEDKNGETPLFRINALYQNAFRNVQRLAQAGASLDHQNKDGQTPLMMAAKSKNLLSIKLLCESGADINFRNTVQNETALSILTNKDTYSYSSNSLDFPCITYLINKGASVLYVNTSFIYFCIAKKELLIIRKMISLGLGPEEAAEKYSYNFTSPLELSLYKGNVQLAKYFNDIWFLTQSDTTMLLSEVDLYEQLLKKENQSCLKFFENFLTQPMSLLKLSFVVVSSAVGAEPGREERITKLKLPVVFENKLLFKHALEVEIEPEVDESKNNADQQYLGMDLFSEERRRKENIMSEMDEPHSFYDDYFPPDSDSWDGW